MKNIVLIFFLSFAFVSCISKQDKAKQEIEKSIRDFMSSELSNIPDFKSLDSVVVTNIDTMSDKDFLFKRKLFVQKELSYYNELFDAQADLTKSQLGMQQLMLESEGNLAEKYKGIVDDSYEKVLKTKTTIDSLINILDGIDSKLSSGNIDSTNFIYWGAEFYIVVTGKNKVQQKSPKMHTILTKDFKIIDPRTIK